MNNWCKCVDGVCVVCNRQMKRCHAKRVCRTLEPRRPNVVHSEKVGSTLKWIFALLGVKADHQCSCKSTARLMDAAGWKWCTRNFWGLAGQLTANAARRGVWLPRLASCGLVLVAVAVALTKRKPPQT